MKPYLIPTHPLHLSNMINHIKMSSYYHPLMATPATKSMPSFTTPRRGLKIRYPINSLPLNKLEPSLLTTTPASATPYQP